MADPDDYLVLEEIIRKLDIPRSMVYIEALLMEVNVEKALDFGVEWSSFGKTTVNERSRRVFGGGFRPGRNLLGGGWRRPAAHRCGQRLFAGHHQRAHHRRQLHLFQHQRPGAGGQNRRCLPHPLHPPDPDHRQRGGQHLPSVKNVPFLTRQTTTSTSNNDTFSSFEYKRRRQDP